MSLREAKLFYRPKVLEQVYKNYKKANHTYYDHGTNVVGDTILYYVCYK